jgi:excisionase family DNA binding protein
MVTKKKAKVREGMPEDLITYTEAAALLNYNGVSGVNRLVERGRLRRYEMFGKPLVSRAEVKAYKPSKGGRPKKGGGK